MMDAIAKLELNRALAMQAIECEERVLPYADSLAHGQSKRKILDLYQTVQSYDCGIRAAKEQKLLIDDRNKAISNAVQKEKIKLMKSLMAEAFVISDYDNGLTAERYTIIQNQLSAAFKELSL